MRRPVSLDHSESTKLVVFCIERVLERIARRLATDGHPLPLSEFFPVQHAAKARSVARSAHAAERNVREVMNGLIVDVHETRANPTRNAQPALEGAGLYRA